MVEVNMGYNKRDMDVLEGIWDSYKEGSMTCPQCGHNLVIVQLDLIDDEESAYVPYDTIIECTHCSFQLRAQSFTILGSVKEFDSRHIDIASWSPMGSRVLSHYEHILDYEQLKRLKESAELVEFLIVNDMVIQIIG